jgi:hypothetical protein
MPIPLYTGQAAMWIRTAIEWRYKAGLWRDMGGPLVADGVQLCQSAAARCMRHGFVMGMNFGKTANLLLEA